MVDRLLDLRTREITLPDDHREAKGRLFGWQNAALYQSRHAHRAAAQNRCRFLSGEQSLRLLLCGVERCDVVTLAESPHGFRRPRLRATTHTVAVQRMSQPRVIAHSAGRLSAGHVPAHPRRRQLFAPLGVPSSRTFLLRKSLAANHLRINRAIVCAGLPLCLCSHV